jgi:energy-coupling factor transporter transmembrane protein EcfT
MRDIYAIWGCGKGPLRLLHAHIRILSGILLGCSSLVVPLNSVLDMLIAAAVTICWCLLAAIPLRMVARVAVASAVLFLPFVLLAPWMTVDPSGASPAILRAMQAAAIALRSTCSLFIAASTISVLAIQDLHYGLASIRLPRTITVLIIQLVNQTMHLAEETARIISVFRLRGATGMRNLIVLFSFPTVWMVRILFRAERTAAAMIVRGYGIEAVTVDRAGLTAVDILAVASTSVIFLGSVLMRLEIVL